MLRDSRQDAFEGVAADEQPLGDDELDDDDEDLDYLATRGRGRGRSVSFVNELEDAEHRERESALHDKVRGAARDEDPYGFSDSGGLYSGDPEPARTELSAKTLDIVTNLEHMQHGAWVNKPGLASGQGGLFREPPVYMSAEEAEEEHELERRASQQARTPSPVESGTPPPSKKARGISGLGRRRKRTSTGASSATSTGASSSPAQTALSGAPSPIAEAASVLAATRNSNSSSDDRSSSGSGRAVGRADSGAARRSSSEPPSPNNSRRASKTDSQTFGDAEEGIALKTAARKQGKPGNRRSFKLGRRRKSSKKFDADALAELDAAGAAAAQTTAADASSSTSTSTSTGHKDLRNGGRADQQATPPPDALAVSDQGDPDAFDHYVKVLLLGDSGVGKTSLMLRFADNAFQPNLMSTAGVDFKVRFLQDAARTGGRRIKCQIWDTAGQERFHVITRTYYRGSHGIALVYDVSSERSFEQMTYWMNNIKSHAGPDVFVVVFGNKVDRQEDRKVTFEQGRDAAAAHGALFYETSAKDGTNVLQAFEALSMNAVQRIEAQRRAAGNDADAQQQQGGQRSGVNLDARPRKWAWCSIL